MRFRLVLCALCSILLCACHKQDSTTQATGNAYAKGFSLRKEAEYTCATIYSPWENGKVMARYYLCSDSARDVPTDGIRLLVPLQRIATTSTTQIGFLNALNALNLLCGVSDKAHTYTPLPDNLPDLGDGMQISTERLFLTLPEALLFSTYGPSDPQLNRLQATQIPLVYINEWTEQHPLARAEWIRLVGAFVGKETEADSLFLQIRNNYEALRSLAQTRKEPKRSILSGGNFRGTWYLPAGNTFMGTLFADAGAQYAFSKDNSAQSIPCNMENVLLQFKDADVWVGCSARSRQELRALDEKHTWFQAYQTGELYHFYRRTNANGANDFWETGTTHPEYILQDMIWALYPELLDSDYVPYFTDKLTDE